jgi:hypothetical protein
MLSLNLPCLPTSHKPHTACPSQPHTGAHTGPHTGNVTPITSSFCRVYSRWRYFYYGFFEITQCSRGRCLTNLPSQPHTISYRKPHTNNTWISSQIPHFFAPSTPRKPIQVSTPGGTSKLIKFYDYRALTVNDLQCDDTSGQISREMARLHCLFEIPEGEELKEYHRSNEVGLWN